MKRKIMKVPNTKWRIRVDNDWITKSASDLFSGKKSLVISLPGAFTPTCSGMQLPSLELLYNNFKAKGIDEVYCLSVNDSFVMNAWAKEHEIEKVKMIPDGSGEFTRDMDMLVFKPFQNFGYRSWRYAMVLNGMEVEKMWVEEGRNQMGLDNDPYDITKPDLILNDL